MTHEKNNLFIITELARSLALAGDILAADCPTSDEIDEAFTEVSLSFFLLRYSVVHQYGRAVNDPLFLTSERFERIWPKLEARLDELCAAAP